MTIIKKYCKNCKTITKYKYEYNIGHSACIECGLAFGIRIDKFPELIELVKLRKESGLLKKSEDRVRSYKLHIKNQNEIIVSLKKQVVELFDENKKLFDERKK